MLAEILQRDFDTDLHDLIRNDMDSSLLTRIRFVRTDAQQQFRAAIANADTSPQLAFLEAFGTFEKGVYRACELVQRDGVPRSTLDIVQK